MDFRSTSAAPLRWIRWAVVVITLLLSLGSPVLATATNGVLKDFSGGVEGIHPRASLLLGLDGAFYGTTHGGGTFGYGTVFKVDTAGTLTVLHAFDWVGGASPYGMLYQASDGSLYGTTLDGGAHAVGTAFKIGPGGAFTLLHSFTGTDGSNPYGGLTRGADGNFYGTTLNGGGTGAAGTVFRMTAAGAVTKLVSFTGPNGSHPYAGLLLASDGLFYGSTHEGGANGVGTVFRMTAAGMLTTLKSFNTTNGSRPYATLVQATDGKLYGSTGFGGASNAGTIFRLELSGAFTTLASFTGANGQIPMAPLFQASDGNFYGTTNAGGSGGYGTAFRMTPAGALTSLHAFTPAEGTNPFGGLVEGANGRFYGAANGGGQTNNGTVFEMLPSGAVTLLHDMIGSPVTPTAGLVEAPDGWLYGTSEAGGQGKGTVYRIDSSGIVQTLHVFSGADGEKPRAGLLLASDGSFYGTTVEGGASDLGTIFKVDVDAGTFSTLHSFNGTNGSNASAELIEGTDGRLYGTTAGGGASGKGVVFKIAKNGTGYSVLRAFNGTNGANPSGRLLQGANGKFYGTTSFGGANNAGTVFSIDSGGAFTTLRSFTGANGSYPYSGLTLGADGKFYGTTFSGGAVGYGSIFKIDTAGTLTTVASFNNSNGAYPYAELFRANDGTLYGTTQYSATSVGTVFKVTPGGGLTTLHSFDGSNGEAPYGTVIIASDGLLYGTTQVGGLTGVGVVFQLDASSAQSGDLVVSALKAPTAAGAGAIISVTDTTKNLGPNAAPASTTRLYFSPTASLNGGSVEIGSRAVPGLATSASDAETSSVTIPAGTATGTYYIIAKADADEAVTEPLESNNTKAKSIKIGPDLRVTSLSVVPTAIAAGSSVTVTDKTKNVGGGPVPTTSTTSFYLSTNSTFGVGDVLLGSRIVPALGARVVNTANTVLTIPVVTAPGAYFIIAVADGPGTVAETLETNNTRAKGLTVQ